MRPLRILGGHEPCDLNALGELVLALTAHAQRVGLTVKTVKMSKLRSSRSRYLVIVDAAGREWAMRVSNHHRPNSSASPPPHVDIIARDGRSGREEACALLDRIARGEVAWHPRTLGWRRPKVRR